MSLPRNRIERRLADGVFHLLLVTAVVLAGWLAARHDHHWDLSLSARNSLGAEGVAVLSRLQGPIEVTVFMNRSHAQARRVEALLLRYRRLAPGMLVRYLDPQRHPEEARNAGVTLVGQVSVEHGGRRETLTRVGEEELTAALARLARTDAPWVAVLEGHGERRADGSGNPDLGRLAGQLEARGYRMQPLDLATTAAVPENTALLVLSQPAIALFPGEADALVRFVESGGSLLWLMDPGALGGLEPLAAYLGVSRLPGVVVDASVADLGVDDPTVARVAEYPAHPLVRGLPAPALLPGSAAFEVAAAAGWSLDTPLMTGEQSWNETGPVQGEIRPEPELGERRGPLPLALVLARSSPVGGEAAQRVVVIGDGDFLSNAHLELAGNRALALALVEWLTTPASAPDTASPAAEAGEALALTRGQTLWIGGVPLLVLPTLFLAVGLVVRRQRRRG